MRSVCQAVEDGTISNLNADLCMKSEAMVANKAPLCMDQARFAVAGLACHARGTESCISLQVPALFYLCMHIGTGEISSPAAAGREIKMSCEVGVDPDKSPARFTSRQWVDVCTIVSARPT